MAEYDMIRYFLGANTPSGFYSLYDQLLPVEQARQICILKGGPGCGKSTLMRKVARELTRAGYTGEYILCSGDPDSLDGVVFRDLGVALVDGTAPHVIEPKYPGVVERYVDLGVCYDRAGLGDVRREIMACMKGYKGCYQRAYRCLRAAAEIRADVRAALTTDTLLARMDRRAKGILSRECRKRKDVPAGAVRQRFLDGVTHRGVICLYPTALAQCQRIYELSDRFGLAHELLSGLLAGFCANGYDVVACPDPMAPERLAHLLIPELSLAFLSTTPERGLPGEPYRRIRVDAMADERLVRRSRPRLRFSGKMVDALVEEGVDSLAQAKAMHDDLEGLYNPYVDFDRVDRMAQEIAGELLGMTGK